MSEHLAHCDKQADFENCLCIEEKVVVLEAQLYQTKNALEKIEVNGGSVGHWANDATGVYHTDGRCGACMSDIAIEALAAFKDPPCPK